MTHSEESIDLFDVIAASPSGTGEDTIAIELSSSDAAALTALAQRTGSSAAAIWRAAWALLVARLGGATEVRLGSDPIAVPREGELAPWLAAVAKPGPGEDTAAVIWQATATGATARFARDRIDRANMERVATLLHATLAGSSHRPRGSSRSRRSPRPSGRASSRPGTRPASSIGPMRRSTHCFASRPRRIPTASRSPGTAARSAIASSIAGPTRSRSA